MTKPFRHDNNDCRMTTQSGHDKTAKRKYFPKKSLSALLFPRGYDIIKEEILIQELF
jgi:hypothetical protein